MRKYLRTLPVKIWKKIIIIREKRQTVLQLGGLLSQLLGVSGGQLAMLIEVGSDFIPPIKGEGRSDWLCLLLRERKRRRRQKNQESELACRWCLQGRG